MAYLLADGNERDDQIIEQIYAHVDPGVFMQTRPSCEVCYDYFLTSRIIPLTRNGM